MKRRQFIGGTIVSLLAGCAKTRTFTLPEYTEWGRLGRRRNGEFFEPRAIHVQDNEVYVIDKTGRIQVFSSDGVFVRTWNIPDATNGTPTDFATGLDGRLLVPDTHWSRIIEYATDGTILDQWGSYGTGEDQFIYPTGVAQASDGAYFVSEYGVDADRVHVFGPDRRFLRQWGSTGDGAGQFARAMSIGLDASNTVYVCDTTNHRVQSFTPDGEFLRVLGGPGEEPGKLRFPYDLSVAPDGSIVLCEYGNHRLSRFAPDGTLIGTFGRPGRGPGEFDAPRAAAVSPDGLVYVADSNNHRIQRFSLEVLR